MINTPIPNESNVLDKPEGNLDLKQYFNRLQIDVDPNAVLKAAKREIEGKKGRVESEPTSNLFKAMTLNEFHNGMLLVTIISEQYKTFAIGLMRDMKKEFNCQTESQKATVELAVISYIRLLEAQRRFNNLLSLDKVNPTTIQFLSVISKEIDRATRHYLTTIQVLNTMNQPKLQLTLKANTAVVGQNQIIQNNHE